MAKLIEESFLYISTKIWSVDNKIEIFDYFNTLETIILVKVTIE